MQRAIGRHLTREMAALGLVEAALSFAAIYGVTTLAGSSLSLPDFIENTPHDHLALASVLIPVAGVIGLAIGLCRTYVSRKRGKNVGDPAFFPCSGSTRCDSLRMCRR